MTTVANTIIDQHAASGLPVIPAHRGGLAHRRFFF